MATGMAAMKAKAPVLQFEQDWNLPEIISLCLEIVRLALCIVFTMVLVVIKVLVAGTYNGAASEY